MAHESCFIVGGAEVEAPEGLRVRNFRAQGIARFPSRGRLARVNELVLHETVTTSVASTVSVLEQQGLSVHLIVGPDGEITQHGDLAVDLLWHAGPHHNGASFGVEVVNPYEPSLCHAGPPWTRTIAAPWAFGGRYVLPTPAQAEAVASLVAWATSGSVPGLAIPRAWPGLAKGAMALGRVPNVDRSAPGVLAHQYFDHADGAWLALYAWLRIEVGLDAERAFEEAVRRATEAHASADVSDLVSTSTRT